MRKLIGLLMAVVISQASWACDQCSVSLGSGILSEGHYIGYRFKFRRQFLEQQLNDGLGKHLDHVESQGAIEEFYLSHELYGNFHLHGDWHISASVPVVNNYRSIDQLTTQDVYGLGDPWAMIRNQHLWLGDSHLLLLSVGAGIKLPIGALHKSYRGEEVDLDMQPGSGSTDLLANLVALYEHKRLMLISQANLKWNGNSPGDYRYGNSLSSSLNMGYTLMDRGSDSWKISLLAGPYLELIGRDATADVRTGDISAEVFASGSLQVRRQRMLLSLQAQQDVYSDVDSRILPTTDWWMLGLQYDF